MASVRLRDSFGLKYLTEFSAISLNISISEHITGYLFINDSINRICILCSNIEQYLVYCSINER